MSYQPRTVTLIDGRQVLSDSEEWRHECEARAVLAMPTVEQRRQYLRGRFDPETQTRRGGILQARGRAACERLEATIMAIWKSKR